MTRSNGQSQGEALGMKRRQFLIGSAVAATSARAWGQRPNQDKLKRIGVMSGCFSSILKSAASPNDPNRTLDILDLPGMLAERYGLHYVELQHSHFASTEPEYLAEFRNRLKKANSQMNQINLELGPLNISTPDPVRRLETIDLTKRWIDHAVALGCPRVMVNPGAPTPEVRKLAIETLKTINAYAKTKKIFVTMENRGVGSSRTNPPGMVTPGPRRGGAPDSAPQQPVYSAPWEVIIELIKSAGIYANPDWLWFPDEEARKEGLAVMYRLTSGSSHCRFEPARFNAEDCVKIAKAAGYQGIYSIEAGRSTDPDPYKAVQSVLDFALANI